MAEHIIEIVFDDRDEAERLFDFLERSTTVMNSGGTLSLRTESSDNTQHNDVTAARFNHLEERLTNIEGLLDERCNQIVTILNSRR